MPGVGIMSARDVNEVLSDFKMRLATVQDALHQARVLYAEGRKDEAFDWLVGHLIRGIDLRSAPYIGSDVVAKDGSEVPEGVDADLERRLYHEGLAPRPTRRP
jgi:hypothetical protein